MAATVPKQTKGTVGWDEGFPPPVDGKRVRFDSRSLVAKFVALAEFELVVVVAVRSRLKRLTKVVVILSSNGVLCEMVLEKLFSLEETELAIKSSRDRGSIVIRLADIC